jgi:hypothetical protein
MTNEMERLYSKLRIVSVKNVIGAFNYLSKEINDLDMNGTYKFEITSISKKNLSKDLKILKKIYKGKLDIEPRSLYVKYQENTHEYFFLKCLVELMKHNTQ